jgi:DNA-binding NtrC family response regulator
LKKNRILIAEDDVSLKRIMEYTLADSGSEVFSFENGKMALDFLKENEVDVIISDLAMPEITGIDLLRAVQKALPDTLFIMITAYGTVETAVEAMKLGAYDYLTKPFSPDELSLVAKKALSMRSLVEENRILKTQLVEHYSFSNIVGNSFKMKEVFDLIGRVAQTNSNILILGESGTGKELVAKAIHYHSERSSSPFVAVQCAAIPATLLESELFGHIKGAFTGAIKDREGKFESADGGTIFLDEIAETSPDMQAKLLRVIQEREVQRVGSNLSFKVDVRIISATNQNLSKAVEQKRFREDLFYRLNVISISLPPLRERREDIPILIKHFLKKFGQPNCQIEKEAWDYLLSYHWPGNVRELENVIERALVLKKGEIITKDVFPEDMLRSDRKIGGVVIDLPEAGINLEELEKELIRLALKKYDGNQTQAAKFLGLSRPTLVYRMEKYGL